MYLYIDFEKCRGCRTCEMVCSFRWDKSFSPTRSAIVVFKNEKEGKNFPIVCQQCSKPLCMEVCLNGAITKDEKKGVVIHDVEKCLGCKMCVLSCPFGGIGYVAELGVARKCDLCQTYSLEPAVAQCEKMCPYQAIKVLKEEEISSYVKKEIYNRIQKLGKHYETLIR